MFRFRRNHLILGMAMNRNKAVSRVESYAYTLVEHIIKCVVYGNSTGNLKHWVEDEICEILSVVNSITIKPSDKKLKKRDYVDTIFGYMGDARSDANVMVRDFRLKNKHNSKYPNFEVTEDLIDRTYKSFQNIMNYMLPILITKNDMKSEDFVKGIYKAIILD